MLIDLGCLFALLALLAVGLRIELFEYIEEGLFADSPDGIMRILRVLSENSEIGGEFLSAALLAACVHCL